jgi:hypothetical protein
VEKRINEPEFLDELAVEYLPPITGQIAELVRETIGVPCTRADVQLKLSFGPYGAVWVASVRGIMASSIGPCDALERLRKSVVSLRDNPRAVA